MKSGKPLFLGLWISTLWGLAGCVSVPLPNQNPTSVASLPINLSVEPEESPKPLVTEALITESLLSKEMPLETHGDLPGKTPAFADLVSLQATDVVSEALKRNQSLVAISKALEAAQSKYSQAISLEDPSIGGWFAPGTIGSNQVDFAMRLELSQKVPSRGKRQLRGEMANAQAKASENDLGGLRLQLVENASNAFYDLYLVQRAMEVSEDTRKILVEFRQNAETRYRNGQTPQQDILQADVELGLQKEKSITLSRMQNVAKARINTLLHLEPDLALPPSVKEISLQPENRNGEELRQLARANRPDLLSLAEIVRADESAVQLAKREFSPDYEAMASYDSFWQGMDKQMQFQLGFRMNLPARLARRYAALREAQSKLAQHKAEYNQLVDQIHFQVQESLEQVRESGQILELFQKTTLKATLANAREAQESYITGKVPFLTLVSAQKEQAMARDRYYQAQAEAFRRKAGLDRATGEGASK